MSLLVVPIAFGPSSPVMYAIYCNTVDLLWKPVFYSQIEAETFIDTQGNCKLESMDLHASYRVGRVIIPGKEPFYVLAGPKSIVWSNQNNTTKLLFFNGLLHVGIEHTSFWGDYWAPICRHTEDPSAEYQEQDFEDYYDKQLNMCEACLKLA